MITEIHTQEIAAVTTAFLASIVEFVEAFTIVLAVGVTRGWRAALSGAIAGFALLVGLVAFFGPALQRIPLAQLKLVVGVLLLLFGMRWLRKASLRSAGVLAFHDEEKAFDREAHALRNSGDPVAFLSAFKAVVIEGIEVVFIVIATGSTGTSFMPAAFGAALAGLLVLSVGLMVHKPLSRVPENSLKYFVGVLLSSFGVFWIGESFGFVWPGEDFAILGLAFGFIVASKLAIHGVRGRPR